MTASALLDLVPGAWIEALALRLAAAGTGLYAALSYDGALDWPPALHGDAAVREAFNATSGATRASVWRWDRRRGGAGGGNGGARVRGAAAPSNWRLGPGDAALERALTGGHRRGAAEAGLAEVAAWVQARAAGRAALHGGPCRSAGAAARRKRAVEDHVAVEPVDMDFRAERVGEAGNRAWCAGPRDPRR